MTTNEFESIKERFNFSELDLIESIIYNKFDFKDEFETNWIDYKKFKQKLKKLYTYESDNWYYYSIGEIFEILDEKFKNSISVFENLYEDIISS